MERSLQIKSNEDKLPPPRSPASGFVWAGMLCLAASGYVGVQAISQASATQSDAPLGNLFYALLLLLCSVPLFYAQARYLFWRRASGALLLHFSPNADAIEIKKTPLAPENTGRWLIYGGLILLAFIPRYLTLNAPQFAAELPLIHAIHNGHALPEQNLFGYFAVSDWLAAQQIRFQGMAATSQSLMPMWVLRLPAFVCGIGTVPLLYITVKLLVGRPIALAAALMLALSPTAVASSGKAQSFAVLLFFAVAHCYFLARAVRDCEANMWLGWLTCMVIGTLFAPTFWVLAVLDAVLLMLRAVWVSSRMRLRAQGVALFEQVLVLGVAYVVFVYALYIFVDWRFPAPLVRLPLLVAPKPFSTQLDTVIGAFLVLIGFAALSLRPSALPVYAVLVFAVGLGVPALVLVAPLLLVLLAAGIEQILRAIMGETDGKALAREATLYGLTLFWIVLHVPNLRDTIKPTQDTRKKTTVATNIHSKSEAKR